MCTGPKFDMYDDLIVEHSVRDLQKTYGFKVPSAF